MIFRGDNRLWRAATYLDIAALLFLLVGWGTLAIVLFIVANIIMLRNLCPSSVGEHKIEKAVTCRVSSSKAKSKGPERQPDWQFVAVKSILKEKKEMQETHIPNGCIMAGPSGKPILVDFDDQGHMMNKAVEVEMPAILKGADHVPDDVVILVHSVGGSDQIIFKTLEVNRLFKDGKKATIAEIAKTGKLQVVVERLRRKYTEGLAKRGIRAYVPAEDVSVEDIDRFLESIPPLEEAQGNSGRREEA